MIAPSHLGHVSDIPEGGSKGFTLDKMAILAVKKDGQIYLYRNHCPHIGIALEWVPDQFLDHSKTLIQCANHGALFDIASGTCVAGPCVGQTLTPISFVVRDGNIFIDDSTIF